RASCPPRARRRRTCCTWPARLWTRATTAPSARRPERRERPTMKFVKSTIHQPTPATAGAPAPAPVAAEPEERVLTFGDVFGRDAGGLIVLLVLFGGMTLASTEFLTADNMANLARQVAVFGIIAVGQLLVILTAGIDLSVGSVLGLSGCVTAQMLVDGTPILLAILIGLAVGILLGL